MQVPSFYFLLSSLQILLKATFLSSFTESYFLSGLYLHLPASHIHQQFSSIIKHMDKTQNY